ncbi:SET domain-containing protein [Cercophora newfieldiana]|uniref:SET domain-containing protein n=1 Tax=Cercophora newfieldiana TaxID=92897 RepID=A0AA39YPT7_9PEZI|nr:SET domain-containing protein [Cercophora newfieldiana]
MDIYDNLLAWAETQGIKLHGISPQRIPGRGIGIVATKQLAANTLILQVPTTSLRSIETVPKTLSKSYPKDAPVHGLLAATLTLDTTPTFTAWNAVVPTASDLTSSLPLAWDPTLHPYLPPAASSLLQKQLTKFTSDHSIFLSSSPAHSDIPKSTYLYNWLLVNTRTFYHETAKTKRLRLRPEDRMVLQPVADLFNHSSSGCNVSFDKTQFTITTDRAYKEGEEVFICYGRHSNDFLLVEYGFVFDYNQWDEVGLDELILPKLSAKQKEDLDEFGFLGKYVLDAETVCYRTQVALRILCLPSRLWLRFVQGEDDGEAHQKKVDELLVSMLRKYVGTIGDTLETIGSLEDGEASQREMLCLRWRQIRRLVDKTITRLES